MKKIALVAFWLSLAVNILNLAEYFWGKIKMVDMRTILGIGMFLIFFLSTIVLLHDKWKQYKDKIEQENAEQEKRIEDIAKLSIKILEELAKSAIRNAENYNTNFQSFIQSNYAVKTGIDEIKMLLRK